MDQRAVAAWVILLVWVAAYTRTIVDSSFPIPDGLLPVMLLAAGYLFGDRIASRLRSRDKETP